MATAINLVDDLLDKISSPNDNNNVINPLLETPSIGSTVLLVCDIEQNLNNDDNKSNDENQKQIKTMIINSIYIIQACLQFDIPIIFSCNNNNKINSEFLKILEENKEQNNLSTICNKTSFSMYQDLNIKEKLNKYGGNKNQIIIIGTEYNLID